MFKKEWVLLLNSFKFKLKKDELNAVVIGSSETKLDCPDLNSKLEIESDPVNFKMRKCGLLRLKSCFI